MTHQFGQLVGVIAARQQLQGVVMIASTAQAETFAGPYSVTPKVASDVILETTKKLMREDVTVLKIPQFEVSNEAGGKTFIIGEEYYDG